MAYETKAALNAGRSLSAFAYKIYFRSVRGNFAPIAQFKQWQAKILGSVIALPIKKALSSRVDRV